MQVLRRRIKVTFYTFLGRILQLYGDIFCNYALILEEKGWVSIANFWWKLGAWFYKRADKVAWGQILDPENYPKKKYIYE